MKVKTISFDLWGTLIKGNPEYKKLRIEFLQQYCNKSENEICDVMQKIKKNADSHVEKYGLQFDDIDLYKTFLSELEIVESKLKVQDFIAFCHTSFINNPPILMDHTIEVLESLKQQNYRIVLSSNTVFIGGKTMRVALIKLRIFEYFYDFIFSDEINYSKPHYEFFKHVNQKSHTLTENILHIGDNQMTDMNGARNYGMNLFLTRDGFSTPETVNSLFNLLKINKNESI